ncbi:MAG: hypothetical protein EBZ18_06170 [Alphaproteobacteria bacterium]|nr:hypothetical protein [Alphaproteobacteria bacterium]
MSDPLLPAMNESQPVSEKRPGRIKRLGMIAGAGLTLLVALFLFATSGLFVRTFVLPRLGNALNAKVTVTDASALDGDDFITIPSAELHCLGKQYDQDGLWHLVANGLPLDFKMASREETITHMISRAREAGAYVSIAHPEWYAMTTDEALIASSAHAVEVFNYSAAIESGRGLGIGTADILLHEGKRMSFTATDDSSPLFLNRGRNSRAVDAR